MAAEKISGNDGLGRAQAGPLVKIQAPQPSAPGNQLPLGQPELQWIYDTAPIGLAFLTPDCRYLQINQRLTEICGISVADHLGRTVREIVPNIADHVEELVRSIVANGEPVTGIEVNGQRADRLGADRCWLTSWHPLKGPDGSILGVNVAAEEITERKRAQAAVHEAQAELARVARLTTMGELSASIAHEINQPLAAVVANGNAALRWLAHTPPNLEQATKAISNIVREGNRAGDVIGRIRSFLRHRKPEYAALDMNGVIREVLALTMNSLQARKVTVQTDLSAELPPALGDRVQLQQVIVNLMMNGADAMSAVTDRPRVLHIGSQIDESGGVLIAIRDSGVGIDDTIRNRIFEPLFTTKTAGMGMGLSICRSIVEAHGGRLWASPAMPHGTDFHFTVPSATAPSANAE